MTALARSERERLTHLVHVVDGALDYFATAGTALAEIRDSGLYRETHDTFEKFCAAQWGMTRSSAYELMAAADVVSGIPDTAPAPANVGQARALAAAAPDDRADVMAKVAAKGKPVTAKAIAAELACRRPTPPAAEPREEEAEASAALTGFFEPAADASPAAGHATCKDCGDPDGLVATGDRCPDCWIAFCDGAEPAPPAQPPAPPPQKRRPLPDQILNAGHDLDRAVERLSRLTTDDRLPQPRRPGGQPTPCPPGPCGRDLHRATRPTGHHQPQPRGEAVTDTIMPHGDVPTHAPTVTTTNVVIDPATAKRWLADNTNRRLRPAIVSRYARDMAAGRWKMTGEAIKFDWNGTLRDGQHRLSAIVQSRVTLVVPVVRGLDPATQAFMDQGAARTASDALQLDGEKYPSILAAAAKLTLIRRLDQARASRERVDRVSEAFYVVRAWNAWRDGKTLQSMKLTGSGGAPTAFPRPI
ncbi:MAG: hypothetical protein WKF86_00250 [Acidimicrobiales bacterium]